MYKLIKTNISKAYWYKDGEFGQAISPHSVQRTGEFFDTVENDDNEINSISWFDSLFIGGGIAVPDDGGISKPVIMLLSGPPGSGKTTLALELCLRVANYHGFWSLYISTESETDQLIKKAKELGIKGTSHRITAYNKAIGNIQARGKRDNRLPILTVYGQENVKKWETFSEIVRLAIDDIVTWLTKSNSNLVKRYLDRFRPGIDLKNISPEVLVFDSLNMVKNDEQHDFFEKIVKGKYPQTKLIIVILDSHDKSQVNETWEFASDIIIRLDYSLIKFDETSLLDYNLRNIEIVKARYQPHVLGRHQMKIYEPFDLPDPKKDPNYQAIMSRAHPYREEGGIFIYPSIHHFLSVYKRLGSTLKVSPVVTPCEGLNKIIEGFPEGRCTAFMGCRGAHKSHLAYLHILERITKHKETGIIVSLRDDEEMTMQHLFRILSEQLIKEKTGGVTRSKRSLDNIRKQIEIDAVQVLDEILNKMALEILYFPPGYITADEFYHRMFMSVYRLKKEGRKITLLFNSLDQLFARFPLCAHQPIFVPAMIESLSGVKVTSLFIAVDEPGQPPTQYGLLPMADLILTFDRYKIRKEDYYKLHQDRKPIRKLLGKSEDIYANATLLEISRFAGGQQAGTRGLLELVYSDKESDSIIDEPGLHFNKWDFEYFKPEALR